MSTLQGLVAWVTGASRGIGRAVAPLPAREGADIAFNHLDGDAAAEQAASENSRQGPRGLPTPRRYGRHRRDAPPRA